MEMFEREFGIKVKMREKRKNSEEKVRNRLGFWKRFLAVILFYFPFGLSFLKAEL